MHAYGGAKTGMAQRPVVLNNSRELKHETISTEVFMPGKDGRVVKDNYQLNRLIRILHYQHQLPGRPHLSGAPFTSFSRTRFWGP